MYSIAEDWALHPNVLGLDLHLPGMIASSRSRGNVCRVSTVMSDIFAPVLGFSSKMVRVSSPSSFIPSMVPVATALQPIMVSRGFFDDRWLYRILPSRDSILNLPVTIVVSSWYIASGNRPCIYICTCTIDKLLDFDNRENFPSLTGMTTGFTVRLSLMVDKTQAEWYGGSSFTRRHDNVRLGCSCIFLGLFPAFCLSFVNH
jgi:hypothetical protein